MTAKLNLDEIAHALATDLGCFEGKILGLTGPQLTVVLFDLIGFSDLPWIAIAERRGLDLNTRNDEGHSIFVEAAYLWSNPTRGDEAGIRRRVYLNVLELLFLGADPNPRATDPFSATALAVNLNIPELATVLVLGGARLDAIEPDMNTPNNDLRGVLENSERQWARNLVGIAERVRVRCSDGRSS